MVKKTKAFRLAKAREYVLAFLSAAILLFLSSKIDPNEPIIRELLSKFAISLIIAILMHISLSLLNYLFVKHAAETRVALEAADLWQRFGIADMSADWNDLKAPTGAGLRLRDHLERLHRDGIWYIVTISPEGFTGEFFKEVILPAVRNGVKLRWAYVRLPSEEEGDAGKALRDWWNSQYTVALHSRQEETLDLARRNLSHNIGEIERIAQEETAKGTIQPNSIEVYESCVPTTYLALLATRKPRGSRSTRVVSKWLGRETPSIALVYPYVMFPLSPPAHHWGMVLTSPGKLYEQYAESIVRFFDEGQALGYLHRI